MSSENIPNQNISNKNLVPRRRIKKRKLDDLINNSGQGDVPVIKIVSDKFNWAAFLIPLIWGFYNKVVHTLWVLLPSFVIPMCLGSFKNSIPASLLAQISMLCLLCNFALCIRFGIKGNTWAWQNNKYKSIEDFHSVQKKWAIGASLFIFFLPLLLIYFFISFFSNIFKF